MLKMGSGSKRGNCRKEWFGLPQFLWANRPRPHRLNLGRLEIRGNGGTSRKSRSILLYNWPKRQLFVQNDASKGDSFRCIGPRQRSNSATTTHISTALICSLAPVEVAWGLVASQGLQSRPEQWWCVIRSHLLVLTDYSTSFSTNYRFFLGSVPRISLYHLHVSLAGYLLFVKHFLSKCLANQFSIRRCFAFGQKLSILRCDW